MLAMTRQRHASRKMQQHRLGLKTPPDVVSLSGSSKCCLDFSRNNGVELQPRAYSKKTSILDVSYCNFEIVKDASWMALTGIAKVLLYGNHLLTLPGSVARGVNVSIKQFSLYSNT